MAAKWQPSQPYLPVAVRQWLFYGGLVACSLVGALAHAGPFVGIGGLEISTPEATQLQITLEADLPLTYHLAVPTADEVTLTFPDAELAEPVRAKLAAMAKAVGLRQAQWKAHTLSLSGPQLALKRLVIHGASPSALQSAALPEETVVITPPPSPVVETPVIVEAPSAVESARPMPVVTPPVMPVKTVAIPTEWSIEELLNQATAAYRLGLLTEAEAYLKETTQRQPAEATLWAAYGEFLLERQQFQSAAEAFRQALVYAPSPTERGMYLDRAAVALRALQPTADGYTQLNHLVMLYDEVARALVLTPWLLGELALDSGQADKAITPLLHAATQLAQTAPEPDATTPVAATLDVARVAEQLALAYELTGQPGEAATWYQKALGWQPTLTDARHGLTRTQAIASALPAVETTSKGTGPTIPTNAAAKSRDWVRWQGVSTLGGMRPAY